MKKPLATRNDLSKYFNVTPMTIRNWEKQGKVVVELVLNGHPRYNLEKTIALIKKG